MSGKVKNADCLLYILLGLGLAFVYRTASASPYNIDGVYRGHNYNLIVYVGSLAAAFVIFLVYALVLAKLQTSLMWADLADPDSSASAGLFRRILYIVYIAAALSAVILIYRIYACENSLYPENTASTYLRQMVPHPVYFGVIAVSAAVLYFSLRTDRAFETKRLLRFGLMPVFAFINAALIFCPNILEDRGAGPLHIHAVLNSIINVMHGVPYSDLNCSIYGHYGLLAAPAAVLLGNDLRGIMLALSVFAFITFFAAFYAAHKLVRSHAVYLFMLFGITGTTTLLTRRGQYFQVNPLRLLFPALTLALTAYAISHTETKRTWIIRLLEYLIGTGALIWNFETGLFSVLVIMAVRVYRVFYTDGFFSRHTVRTFFRAVVYGALCAVLAYGAVGIYNLTHGGLFGTVKQFIYPLFSGTYNVNHLRTPLPSVTFLYFFQILLFLFTALIMLRRQALHTDEEHVSETIAFAASVSGLLSLIYFMNRAAYGNMSISHIQMILVIGYWAAESLSYRTGDRNGIPLPPSSFLALSFRAILFGCSLWLAVEGAMYIQVASDYRAKSSWDTASLDEAAAAIASEIPKDTFAFGTYIPEMYQMLGWDTHCRMTDWSDMNDLNRNYAMTEAHKQQAVLTSEAFDDPAFTLIKEIPVGKYTFSYYQRTA